MKMVVSDIKSLNLELWNAIAYQVKHFQYEQLLDLIQL